MSREFQRAWERTCRRHAARVAVIETGTGRSCTFAELDARAAAWAERHLANGKPVRRQAVVFAAGNGMEWLAIAIALIRADAVLVPVDPAEPAAAQRSAATALRAGFYWDGRALHALPAAKRFRDPRSGLIKLTSGTTGQPRALVFTDAQMLADGAQVTASMGLRPRDLNYAVIPFGHSYGLGNLVVPLLAHGIPVACGNSPLPHAIAADFAHWRPTVLPAVPAVFRALIASDVAAATLTSLRVAISAGAPLPPETAQGFAGRFNRRIHSFYGSSETGGIAYDRSGLATLAGGVGTAMRGVRIKSLRGDRILISSAAVFTHGNRRRVGGHGAWIPPDIARTDAGGGMTLLGRRGQTVKVGARRLNLGEIAARIRALSRVDEVWVGVSGEPEAVLGAAVVTAATVPELRAMLARNLPAWKIPKRWAVLPVFPLTSRGKTDTRALRETVFSRSGAVGPS
jgi:acyl-CoA synthetase (AMP-forming)/AMP-acid ligase II